MNPELAERYMSLMKKYGVQNLQIEDNGVKLILCGIYEELPTPQLPDISREDAMDKLKDD